MKAFKDFAIKPAADGFIGDKIKMERILNREIVVHRYELKDSKFGDGKCMYMQISIGENKHVVFTIAKRLIETIQQVPHDGFPFNTTIIKDNDRFEFS